jgi:hypothetical protein
MQTLFTGGELHAGIYLGRALDGGNCRCIAAVRCIADAEVALKEFCVSPCHGTVALVSIVAGAHPLVSVAVAVGGGAHIATASHFHCF